MGIKDKTTDSRVPKSIRKEIMRICKELNREELNRETPFLLITEFEVEQA